MLTHDGPLWKIPVAGTPWDIEATRLYGKGSPAGIVEAVGVVP